MKDRNILQQAFYILGIILMTLFLMIHGQFILIPVAYSFLFAMLFSPVIKRMRSVFKSHLFSYIVTAILFLVIVFIPIFLLTGQVTDLFTELSGESLNFESMGDKAIEVLKEKGIYFPKMLDSVTANLGISLSWIGRILGSIVSSSSSFALYLALSLVFAYFLTSYYEEFKRIVFSEFEKSQRVKWQEILTEAPSIVRSYLNGMLIVMAILAVLNGILFLAIGLKYALVWALFAGLLAIIPYVGSLIGVMMPTLYSIIYTGNYSMAITILVGFVIIQQIEGNFLTPKIVGDKINVNPMIVIILMLIFGRLWGISGIIICLPLAGIVRVAMEQWEKSEFIAEIMSSKQ